MGLLEIIKMSYSILVKVELPNVIPRKKLKFFDDSYMKEIAYKALWKVGLWKNWQN